MTNNLELWDKVRRVPQEHLKGFKRAGGFSGTAIKPMWGIHTMTEQFGPCGEGWGIDRPEYTIQTAGSEILVFCTVGVWHMKDGKPSGMVYGVGGDKVLAQFSSGLKADDEAFKKAFTDAVGNALKFLGVGADIHMGLWDGNKYVDEKPEDKPAPKSKATSREDFDRMVKEIRNITSVKALLQWGAENEAATIALPPDWFDDLTVEYNDKKSELKKALAA